MTLWEAFAIISMLTSPSMRLESRAWTEASSLASRAISRVAGGILRRVLGANLLIPPS